MMLFRLILVFSFICFSGIAQANWLGQGIAAASSSVAGSPQNGGCSEGFNEKGPRQDFTPHEPHRAYEKKCQSGETWAECARRMFLGN